MLEINVDEGKCNKCGNCVTVCPFGIMQARKGEVPKAVGLGNCMVCGQCAASCPTGALTHASFPMGTIVPIDAAKVPTPEQFLELLKGRRSVRAFRPDPVPKDMLQMVVRSAAFAPTAHNIRSVEFVVVQDKVRIKELAAYTVEGLDKYTGYMKKSLPRFLMKRKMKNQYHWMEDMRPAFEMVVAESKKGTDYVLRDAPALIAFVSDPNKTYNDVNAQLAIENAQLACHALGLGSFYCGFASSMAKMDPRFATSLGLKPGRSIDGIIALGFPIVKMKNTIERDGPVTWL